MKKNEAKSKRRKSRRLRWFIYKNQSRQYKTPFRSEGAAAAFLRSLQLDPRKYDFIKERVTA